jgi:hypothetical protein
MSTPTAHEQGHGNKDPHQDWHAHCDGQVVTRNPNGEYVLSSCPLPARVGQQWATQLTDNGLAHWLVTTLALLTVVRAESTAAATSGVSTTTRWECLYYERALMGTRKPGLWYVERSELHSTPATHAGTSFP